MHYDYKNRFYLRFRDSYRQLALEVLQGVSVYEDDLNNPSANLKVSASTGSQLNNLRNETAIEINGSNTAISVEDTLQAEREREENIRQLVTDCRKQLIDANEDCYGSWALINYNEYVKYLLINTNRTNECFFLTKNQKS